MVNGGAGRGFVSLRTSQILFFVARGYRLFVYAKS